MADNQQRRQLDFKTLDDIVAEAHRLLETGYISKGNWDLAQTCFHLAEWARFPMDGFPKPPFVLRVVFGAMKAAGIVRRMSKGILENGFSPGSPTAPQTVTDSGTMNDRDGVEQLTNVIERMKQFDGELHPSPLFGAMDRELWTRLTLLHSEHHFRFLDPK